MNLKNELLTGLYFPVGWEYREIIETESKKKTDGKIFYFCPEEGICEGQGTIVEMKDSQSDGIFLVLSDQSKIRIDRIITLFGKPGAAYEEYDGYSNSCMSCLGGYEKDEI
ncbi:hypothetical protein [Pedobacter kyonggii]|uniref:Uncharacterized protein n=1 Tax=Pedobacter kyonggii TaxID=1926871 RepID=A0A4Q9H9N7_9SPHI|nr:hypothetical protein [Pedobacter kyonggii]TBO40560.1 hypothetical protein EYS08_18075 [Pedobacter kyonggii]